MRLLLVVVLGVLSVTVLVLLVMALRRNSPVDVEGWHRKLRILRDTAQPDAARPADELIVDTPERNVRVVPSAALDDDLAPDVDTDGEPAAGEEDVPDAGAREGELSSGPLPGDGAPDSGAGVSGDDARDPDPGVGEQSATGAPRENDEVADVGDDLPSADSELAAGDEGAGGEGGTDPDGVSPGTDDPGAGTEDRGSETEDPGSDTDDQSGGTEDRGSDTDDQGAGTGDRTLVTDGDVSSVGDPAAGGQGSTTGEQAVTPLPATGPSKRTGKRKSRSRPPSGASRKDSAARGR